MKTTVGVNFKVMSGGSLFLFIRLTRRWCKQLVWCQEWGMRLRSTAAWSIHRSWSSTTTLRMPTMCTLYWRCVTIENSTDTSKSPKRDWLKRKVECVYACAKEESIFYVSCFSTSNIQSGSAGSTLSTLTQHSPPRSQPLKPPPHERHGCCKKF